MPVKFAFFKITPCTKLECSIHEKVILSSCGLFTLASLGRKRPYHEDKITFSHLYRK